MVGGRSRVDIDEGEVCRSRDDAGAVEGHDDEVAGGIHDGDEE